MNVDTPHKCKYHQEIEIHKIPQTISSNVKNKYPQEESTLNHQNIITTVNSPAVIKNVTLQELDFFYRLKMQLRPPTLQK